MWTVVSRPKAAFFFPIRRMKLSPVSTLGSVLGELDQNAD